MYKPSITVILFFIILVAIISFIVVTFTDVTKSCGGCDDYNECTEDSCTLGKCVNKVITPCVGNNICETGEDTTADCGYCDDGNVCTIDTFDTASNGCKNTPLIPCCGDNQCAFGENYDDCPTDCTISNVNEDMTIGGTALVTQDIDTTHILTLTPGAQLHATTGKDNENIISGRYNLLANVLQDPTVSDTYTDRAITIRAIINAVGTTNQPILFSASPAQSSVDWEGLILLSGSQLKNVYIESARSGVTINENVVFTNNVVRRALWSCIYVDSSVTITGNTVEDCGIAGIEIGGGSPTISNNNIYLTPVGVKVDADGSTIRENQMGKIGVQVWPCTNCKNIKGRAILLDDNEELGYFVNGRLVYWSDNSGDLYEMRDRNVAGNFFTADTFVNDKISFTQEAGDGPTLYLDNSSVSNFN